MGQRDWSEEEVDSLKRGVKDFRKMLGETLDEHCNAGANTPKYHFLGHMMKDINILGTFSDLNSSRQGLYSKYNEQAYRNTLQRKRTQRMEAVNVIERSYNNALPYRKIDIYRKLGRKDENGKN